MFGCYTNPRESKDRVEHYPLCYSPHTTPLFRNQLTLSQRHNQEAENAHCAEAVIHSWQVFQGPPKVVSFHQIRLSLVFSALPLPPSPHSPGSASLSLKERTLFLEPTFKPASTNAWKTLSFPERAAMWRTVFSVCGEGFRVSTRLRRLSKFPPLAPFLFNSHRTQTSTPATFVFQEGYFAFVEGGVIAQCP